MKKQLYFYQFHELVGQFNAGSGLYSSPQQKQLFTKSGFVDRGALFCKVGAQFPIAFNSVNFLSSIRYMLSMSSGYPKYLVLITISNPHRNSDTAKNTHKKSQIC